MGEPLIQIGRVVRKIAGREAGRLGVILDIIDKNFVLIDGPNIKRRRCNIKHLEFLPNKIDVNKNTKKEEIVEKLKAIGLIPSDFKLKPKNKKKK